MKLLTKASLTPPKLPGEKPVVTISISHVGVTPTPVPTSSVQPSRTVVAGAVLAGLTLSRTRFLARARLEKGTIAQAKLRV